MYPYDEVEKVKSINEQEIFVAMPFGDSYNESYFNDLSANLIVKATERANEILGYKDDANEKLSAYFPKEELLTTCGWENVLKRILRSGLVLGVLDTNNPNVFYELGIAHTYLPKYRQILIARKGYKPPFDIKDIIFSDYDLPLKDYVEELAQKIAKAAKGRSGGRERRINHVRTLINPCGFAAILWWKDQAHFRFSLKEVFRQDILKIEKVRNNPVGEQIYDYLLDGLRNLCSAGLLVLNTNKISENQFEFSYYWTHLGNEVLYNMEMIAKEEVEIRWKAIPTEYSNPVL